MHCLWEKDCLGSILKILMLISLFSVADRLSFFSPQRKPQKIPTTIALKALEGEAVSGGGGRVLLDSCG